MSASLCMAIAGGLGRNCVTNDDAPASATDHPRLAVAAQARRRDSIRGRADVLPVHAHRDMQVCLNLDFPGRYAYRGRLHDVPAGAVSSSIRGSRTPPATRAIATGCPIRRDVASIGNVRSSMEWNASARSIVRFDAVTVQRFLALHRALDRASPSSRTSVVTPSPAGCSTRGVRHVQTVGRIARTRARLHRSARGRAHRRP